MQNLKQKLQTLTPEEQQFIISAINALAKSENNDTATKQAGLVNRNMARLFMTDY